MKNDRNICSITIIDSLLKTENVWFHFLNLLIPSRVRERVQELQKADNVPTIFATC